ncbi:MazG family protein [Haloechinothrix sp. LS1_15]|nr:MazG family protein [Haloechinothrix sp. LS1_15]MDV6011496.1 MazG family protein [Haloechinothrix sp. LS1_15]
MVQCARQLSDALPAAAVPVLGSASAIYATAGVPDSVRRVTGAEPCPDPAVLRAEAASSAVVLLVTDPDGKAAAALHDAGAPRIAATVPALLDAVGVMDRLRSPGGCPWDAEQTHESLRQYLVEETYELLEAIESGDRASLREELGDVLLQVLFHARVATEHGTDPFDIEEVARGLVSKLVERHPQVFGGGEDGENTAERQDLRWEELKRSQRGRQSAVDGVVLGQPAVALAAKLARRARRAGIPDDLLPSDTGIGAGLFRFVAMAEWAGHEPEGELRAAAKQFIADLRDAEAAATRDGADPAALDAKAWRYYWPEARTD